MPEEALLSYGLIENAQQASPGRSTRRNLRGVDEVVDCCVRLVGSVSSLVGGAWRHGAFWGYQERKGDKICRIKWLYRILRGFLKIVFVEND